MAESSTAFAAAADSTDGAATRAKKKRIKKKRSSAATDLSTLTVDSSLLVPPIQPPAIASTSRTTIEVVAEADRANLSSKVATAIPPHLVQSKKRKRSRTLSTEVSDAGNASNASETLQASTTLTSESGSHNRKNRKKNRKTSAETKTVEENGAVSPFQPLLQLLKPTSATYHDPSSSRAPASTAAPTRPTETTTAPTTEAVNAQTSLHLPDDAEPDSSRIAMGKKRKKKKKEQKRHSVIEEATTSVLSQDTPALQDISAGEISADFGMEEYAVPGIHLLLTEPFQEDPLALHSTNASPASILDVASTLEVTNAPGQKQQANLITKEVQQGSSHSGTPDIGQTPLEERLDHATLSTSRLRLDASARSSQAPTDQLDNDLIRTYSVGTMTSPVPAGPDGMQSSRIHASSTTYGARADTTPTASTSQQVAAPGMMPGIVQNAEARAHSPRIRLFDEESDSDLHHFAMREYDEDDTNHTDDEEAGLYLPQASGAHSLRLRSLLSPSVGSSSPSRKITSANQDNVLNVAPPQPSLTASRRKLGSKKHSISDSQQDSTRETLSKPSKSLSYTTPSKIMQNLEESRHKAVASISAPLNINNDVPQEETLGIHAVVTISPEDTARHDVLASAPPEAAVDSSNAFESFSNKMATADSPKRIQANAKKARVLKSRPVVEVPVRRAGSSLSPRKSVNKLSQRSPPGKDPASEALQSPSMTASRQPQSEKSSKDIPLVDKTSLTPAQMETATDLDRPSIDHQSTNPSTSSPQLSVSSPSLPTNGDNLKNVPSPPAEQSPITTNIRADHEEMPPSRVLNFLDQLESDDDDSDPSETDSRDSTTSFDDLAEHRARRRALPPTRGRPRRNASSSPEPLSEQSDTDTEDRHDMTLTAPEIQTADNSASMQVPAVPSPDHAVGIFNSINEDPNMSQSLLETIEQMVSSGEARKARGGNAGESDIEVTKQSSPNPAETDVTTAELPLSPGHMHLDDPSTDLSIEESHQDRETNQSESAHPDREVQETIVPGPSEAPVVPDQALMLSADPLSLNEESALGLILNEAHLNETAASPASSLANDFEQAGPSSTASASLSADMVEDLNIRAPDSEDFNISAPDPMSRNTVSHMTSETSAFASSTSMPSPSPSVRNIYPSLTALDSEMSQPVFAALSTQSSPPGEAEDSQMDELEQTQVLEEGPSHRIKFRDIGPTPSPLQVGFDTASQIDELMQSSFDERSMMTAQIPKKHQRDAEAREASSSESLSSDDSESDADIQRTFVKSQATVPNPKGSTVKQLGSGDIFTSKAASSLSSASISPSAGTQEQVSASLALPAADLEPEALQGGTSQLTGISSTAQIVSALNGQSEDSQGHTVEAARGYNLSPNKRTMAIPSALPRSNSISAISTRFKGKLAERRNSGTMSRVIPQVKPQPVPTQSADSSDDSESEEDSDSDNNVTPEQPTNGKARRIGLASLR